MVIGKQFEENENLQKLLEIVNEKNINLEVVERGNKINIEKGIYFDVFWPDSKNAVSYNAVNNNALVCKFNYKNFSILFTGDIEKEAEEVLYEMYGETEALKSKILKVAHHGSKTSTSQKFLELVMPKISLIGVGKNNLYNHPSKEILERLKDNNVKIYRTDENGEITIKTNGTRWKLYSMFN